MSIVSITAIFFVHVQTFVDILQTCLNLMVFCLILVFAEVCKLCSYDITLTVVLHVRWNAICPL